METIFVLTSIYFDPDDYEREELFGIFTSYEKAETFIKQRFSNLDIVKDGVWHGLNSWKIGNEYILREQKLNNEVIW